MQSVTANAAASIKRYIAIPLGCRRLTLIGNCWMPMACLRKLGRYIASDSAVEPALRLSSAETVQPVQEKGSENFELHFPLGIGIYTNLSPFACKLRAPASHFSGRGDGGEGQRSLLKQEILCLLNHVRTAKSGTQELLLDEHYKPHEMQVSQASFPLIPGPYSPNTNSLRLACVWGIREQALCRYNPRGGNV